MAKKQPSPLWIGIVALALLVAIGFYRMPSDTVFTLKTPLTFNGVEIGSIRQKDIVELEKQYVIDPKKTDSVIIDRLNGMTTCEAYWDRMSQDKALDLPGALYSLEGTFIRQCGVLTHLKNAQAAKKRFIHKNMTKELETCDAGADADSDQKSITRTELVRADFNGDNVEDVLVEMVELGCTTTWRTIYLQLLTKTTKLEKIHAITD